MGTVRLLLSVTALHASWTRDWLLATAVGPPPRPRCGLWPPTIPSSTESLQEGPSTAGHGPSGLHAANQSLSPPTSLFSLSQNRRMEASRLGQGVALQLELVSRCVPCEARVSVPVSLPVSLGGEGGAKLSPVSGRVAAGDAHRTMSGR